MQNITHTYLNNIKPTGKIQNIACGDALSLRVSAKGKKTWYLRYDTVSAEGKRKQNIVSLGEFPNLSLKDARSEAEMRKTMAKNANTNLVQVKKEEQISKYRNSDLSTFKEVTEAWLSLKRTEWSESTYKDSVSRLSSNIYPMIGNMPIRSVTVDDIEKCLKNIMTRGAIDLSRRVHTLIVSIFKYALAKGYIKEPDMVVRLTWYKEQMPKPKTQSLYSEELSPDEIGNLLASIYATRHRWTLPVSVALQLAPYCVVRPSELLGARWSELDLDNAEWIIPAERMKMKRPHLVPLPHQAVALFKQIQEFSGKNTLVFPSTFSKVKENPVSSMALIQALRRMGYRGENGTRFVTHGFRGMFSTIAYNTLGASSLCVEMQLAHSEKDKIKAAYHKTSLRSVIDERRALLQQYADYIDDLRGRAS